MTRIVRRWCRWQDWLSIRRKRVWVLLFLLAYSLAGFFLLPWVLHRQLPAQLGELLQRSVTLDVVRVNPWLLRVELQGVRLTEADGAPIAAFDRLLVDLQLASLWRRAWVFREIALERPVVELIRFADGGTNLQRLLPPAESPAVEQPAAAPPRLRIESLNVSGGELGIVDRSPATPFTTRLLPIDLQAQGLGTLAGESGHQSLRVGGEGGLELVVDGDVQLNPLALSGSVKTSGPYPLLAYRYAQDLFNARLARGGLDLGFDYRVTQAEAGTTVSIDGLSLGLRDLLLEDKASGTALLGLPAVRLSGGRFSWPEQLVSAHSLQLDGPSLALARLADGSLDWQQLLAGAPGQPAVETVSPDPAVVEGPPVSSPWQLRLDEFAVDDMAVTFDDQAVPGTAPLAATDLDLRVTGLSNAPGASFPLTLAGTLLGEGQLAVDGQLVALPQTLVESRLQLSGLPLAVAQPYLDQFANILIKGGGLHLDVQLNSSPDDPLSARGALEVTGMDTVTRERNLPLLAWKSARIDTFKYSTASNVLVIAGIAFDQPYFRVRVNEHSTTSLQRLLVERAQAARVGPPEDGMSDGAAANGPSAVGAAAVPIAEPAADVAVTRDKPFIFRLGPVTLADGITDFSDFNLPVPFSTRVTGLTGGTSPLDTDSREPMKIKLEGQVAEYGMARIEGAFLPVAPWQNTWLGLTFRNVVLPDLSPYTIRFAGYQFAGGRMDLDLRYTVDHGRLQGGNNVILRDVQLGDKVPYEGAMDLPLGLAIALLKGPDGRIDVDLPVAGDVNDPQFRIGGVVRKALANLITRIVTAPFRLLGSLVGMESSEFEHIVFAPGEAVVTPPEREKLAKLATAMAQRPQIALRIPGVVAEAEDTAALRELRVDAAIAQRLAAVARPGDSPETAWRQRREVLEALFAASYPDRSPQDLHDAHLIPEDPADPEGRQRLDDVAYYAHLRRELVAAEAVPPDALQQLAAARAQAVAAELVAAGLEAERARVEEAKAGKPGKNGWIGLELAVDQR